MFKFLKFITEAIGWLQIVASPFLIGLGIGAVIYFSKPDTTRLILGISIATLGLIVGIIIATRIWKKKGTVNFMSRITATPELDETQKTTDRK